MTRCFSSSFIFISSFLFLLLSCPVFAQHEPAPAEGQVHTLAPIIVTAEQIIEYVKNHPQNVVILNQDEIKDRNFLEIGDALDSMPGVDVRESGGGMGTKISIRGGGGSGPVLILVDGRPVNSGQYGGVDLGSIPIDIVKKVVVFKPPVPVWLGSGSSAGAVNIVTKGPSERVSEKRENKGRLKINGGSYGTANINATYVIPQTNGQIRLAAGDAHKDGKRANSDRDSGNFSFNWSKESQSDTKYDLNGRYYNTEHGCSGPTDNPTPDARQHYQKGSLDFRAEGFIGDTSEFSLKSYADIEDLKDRPQAGNESTLEVYKIGMSGENIWSGDEGWALRLGGLIEENRIEHDISGDHHREKFSLHVQHDREVDAFTLSIGLRGDHTSDFGWFPGMSAGLSYAIGPDTLIKGNAGYSVRSPSFNQLYQPSHGSIDQVRGNSDLSEEDIFSYDLSLEHKFSQDITANVALFRTDTKDLISYQRDNDLIYRPANISHAYKQGIEFLLKSKWTKYFSADFNYIYQDTENKETGSELAYSPEHSAKLTGKLVLPARTRIETVLKYKGNQYSSPDTAQAEKIDAYCVVNLKIIQPVMIKSSPSEIFIHVHNLFDTDFESHAGYPDDGFKFLAGININF
ncbi:MAG: TonB-dependent receptor [Deltaproteobacteria bacterium]|nr:TonB-dependent receptor [Deltaproteobacteria bacterium]MBW2344728.1 TonB-dependent receptor [Deltaproteobacteria bacterium]